MKKCPDMHVDILDMVAEDDKVVVQNRLTGTEAATGKKIEFSGIVIWREVTHKRTIFRFSSMGVS